MVCRGKVVNGVIVLEEGLSLPDGTTVRVETIESGNAVDSDPLYKLSELAAPTGIRDLARNIDHYLYGHPRVGDDS